MADSNIDAGREALLHALTDAAGRLLVTVPSRVRVEDGPHGVRFAAGAADALDAERARELIERDRR